MSQIAQAIGEARAAILSERAGGLRIVIPAALTNGQAPKGLADRVGCDLAIALILHFPGSLLYVPHGRPKAGRVDVRKVAKLTRKRMSANTIAARLKCSVRTVYAKRTEARSAGLLPAISNGPTKGAK